VDDLVFGAVVKACDHAGWNDIGSFRYPKRYTQEISNCGCSMLSETTEGASEEIPDCAMDKEVHILYIRPYTLRSNY